MLVAILAVLAALVFLHVWQKHKFWKVRNVKYVPPMPFLGNLWPSVSRKVPFADLVQQLYNRFPQERYLGLFHVNDKPFLMVRDLELLKQVTVKDFDTFPEHIKLIDETIDPLWGKNLFSSREASWRQLRPTLSPAFTSSKMKSMFHLIKETADEFVKHFLDKTDQTITINSKDVFTRYANDVIASIAFGVKCNSLKEPNNEFYLMGADATNLTGLRSLKFVVGAKWSKILGIKIFSTKVRTFFRNLIDETIDMREKQGIVRPDMIHLLMESRKSAVAHENQAEESELPKAKKKQHLSNEDITAQALIFFLAGFDTVSTLMCYMAHELALNPEVQSKLRDEIDEAWAESNGDITYEKLMNLKYLDMVTSETLRKWPPTVATDRTSVKPYTIPAKEPNEPTLHLSSGFQLWLPIYPIQRDPKYYPDPEKFDPERFSDENKSSIDPAAYFPFGLGPRNCIGSRFALMESKIIYFYILRYFEIHVVDKTPIPVQLTADFNLTPKGGFWVGLKALKPRNNND